MIEPVPKYHNNFEINTLINSINVNPCFFFCLQFHSFDFNLALISFTASQSGYGGSMVFVCCPVFLSSLLVTTFTSCCYPHCRLAQTAVRPVPSAADCSLCMDCSQLPPYCSLTLPSCSQPCRAICTNVCSVMEALEPAPGHLPRKSESISMKQT